MRSEVCIDASLALSWLLSSERNPQANRLRQEWDESEIELVSAPIFHAEVTSVLREQVFFKKIPAEEGEGAFQLYLNIGVRSINQQTVTRFAWELAKKYNVPRTYDMQYLAVAELLDCPLWTNDKKFVNSLQGRTSRVSWVGDYEVKGK